MGSDDDSEMVATRVSGSLYQGFERYTDRHDFTSRSEALRHLMKDAVRDDYYDLITLREAARHAPLSVAFAVPALLLGALGFTTGALTGIYMGYQSGFGSMNYSTINLLYPIGIMAMSALFLIVPGWALQERARYKTADHHRRMGEHPEKERAAADGGDTSEVPTES